MPELEVTKVFDPNINYFLTSCTLGLLLKKNKITSWRHIVSWTHYWRDKTFIEFHPVTGNPFFPSILVVMILVQFLTTYSWKRCYWMNGFVSMFIHFPTILLGAGIKQYSIHCELMFFSHSKDFSKISLDALQSHRTTNTLKFMETCFMKWPLSIVKSSVPIFSCWDLLQEALFRVPSIWSVIPLAGSLITHNTFF